MSKKFAPFNELLVREILLEPITVGANKLIIISGYVSHNIASWHIKRISEEKLPAINISLTVGMCQQGGISQDIHNGLKALMSFHDDCYSSFDCKYIYKGVPVHSKIYIWLKDDKPIKAYCGSANYTSRGFSSAQREYVTECDPSSAYSYYLSLEDDSIICNHGEI